MFKKIITSRKGLTFIELMIAIAIIAIISAISVVYIRGDVYDDVESTTEQLAADLRYTRNLSKSRTSFNFAGAGAGFPTQLGETYPPGGYGVWFYDPSSGPSKYVIFADSGIDGTDAGSSALGYDADKDPIVKQVILDNNTIELDDINGPGESHVFVFSSENDVYTDLTLNAFKKYQVAVIYPSPGYPSKGYRGIIDLGEYIDDQYTLTSIGIGFAEYVPPKPPSPPKEDPVMEMAF